MRRLAILLATMLLLAACGGGDPTVSATASPPSPTPTTATETGATSTPTDAPAPADSPTAQPTATATEPETDTDSDTDTGATTATAWFARIDDSGSWVEPVTADFDEPTLGVARAAFELLVSGEPADPGLSSQTGPGVEVLGVDIDGGVLTVDLSGALRNNRSGSAGESALAQQLAWTGTQFDGVDAVRLHVDGAVISDLWGHLDWSEPVEPDPFAESPITFSSHTWGEQVPAGQLTVNGEANTFEANLQLRLLDPDGAVVEETFATATSGSGERGTWSHAFTLDRAGTWTIEATEDDPSDGEGRPPFTTRLELRAT
jgi:hypothetical protein